MWWNVCRMELEDLYKRYCSRLKHSLFLSGLGVAAATCTCVLVAVLIQVSQKSALHIFNRVSEIYIISVGWFLTTEMHVNVVYNRQKYNISQLVIS